MDDILIGKRMIKDGVTTFVTENEIWILKESQTQGVSDKVNQQEPLVKSKVCHDCDYATFAHSECDWFCNLTKGFTKGYCEVAD
jgi:hypothetical protein